MRSLNPKKAGTDNDIPAKILKSCKDSCTPFSKDLFNNIITTGLFHEKLKLPDINPIFKKKDPFNKENYRPESVLPVVSKIFKRLLKEQMNCFIEEFLSPYLCGYRKGFSVQQALISINGNWKTNLDKKSYRGAIFMDLSRAFDTINHELLLAKLHKCDFNKDTLKTIHNYLKNWYQRTKIKKVFSSWNEILLGVPRESVLGPLLFNIHLNHMTYLVKKSGICNSADDMTFHACDSILDSLVKRLEHERNFAIEWFDSNYMKLKQDECHLMISGHKFEAVWATIWETQICGDRQQKLLPKVTMKMIWILINL